MSSVTSAECVAGQDGVETHGRGHGPGKDRELLQHPVYARVTDARGLRKFMETHVFAVWDFQSLLKAMQRQLTCTSVPWVPTADPEARRLVNEIVLDEESDELPRDEAERLGLMGPKGPLVSASHFEIYLAAMRQAGANTRPIGRLITLLRDGMPLATALASCGGPPAALDFVRHTFSVIESGETHRIVAAFAYGREDVIPSMFRNLVASLAEEDPDTWGIFRFYLERHIVHDDEKHAPLCRQIAASLCGDDPVKWSDASATARSCIQARIALWDAIALDLA